MNITETDLRMFFGRYGNVKEIEIAYDRVRKRPRGFGFLSFENDASVDRVINQNYVTLNGKQVKIQLAREDSTNQDESRQEPQPSTSSNVSAQPGPSGLGTQRQNSQLNAGPSRIVAPSNTTVQTSRVTAPQQTQSNRASNPISFQRRETPTAPPLHLLSESGSNNTTSHQNQRYRQNYGIFHLF